MRRKANTTATARKDPLKFKTDYCMSPFQMAHALEHPGVTKEEARKLIKLYFEKFPKAHALLNPQIN